jgi:hypothetical protein
MRTSRARVPLAALAPELARADKGTKPQIVAELANYKSQNAAIHSWPANRGSRTYFLCDFFNDDRGS